MSVEIDGVNNIIKADTISEVTSANGVAIDGVTLKDSVVLTDTISEKTSANGVAIDSVTLKDGKVGIGTTSPSTDLHIKSTADNAPHLLLENFQNADTDDAPVIELYLNDQTTGGIGDNTDVGVIRFTGDEKDGGSKETYAEIRGVAHDPGQNTSNRGHLSLFVQSAGSLAETMTLDESRVGVGTASPATALDVNGTATVGALSDGTVTKSKIAFHQWKLTSNLSVSSGAADITAGMTQVEAVGSVLSVSSGVFTFPYTGKWFIQYQIHGNSSPAAAYRGGAISATTDGSNFAEIRNGFTSNTASTYWGVNIHYAFDVTNVSTHKVKFRAENAASGTVGSGTNFAFTYLGDT